MDSSKTKTYLWLAIGNNMYFTTVHSLADYITIKTNLVV